MDFGTVQFFKLFIMVVPAHALLYFVFRKKVWQNIFLQATAILYTPICNGMGIYAGENWFSESPVTAANIVSLAVAVLTLPPLLFMLRRLYENPYIMRAGIWRFIWLLPGSYLAVLLLTGNLFDPGTFAGISFIFIRILIYGALLLTCYLLETSLRQVMKYKDAKRKADELTAKTEFYHRMAHELLTPLTRVSTCVQTARTRPEEADELLTMSQTEIMDMAEMIKNALEEQGDGA
jgi:signal transduction histidine kinase